MADSDGKTILLVEDEALIALAQEQTLERHGYRVIRASTGEQAIRIASAHDDIDLVLMDIDLGPGMDGTEAAARILDDRDLPVVFLSSHTAPAIVEKTERLTSYGYIVKSSGETVLLASLRMAFRLFEARRLNLETLEGLAQEKERLRVTLRSVGDAVIATDAQGCVTFLNPVAERLTGHAAQAAAGRPLAEIFRIVNAVTREPAENPVARVLAEGRVVGLANHTVLISPGGDEYQIADSAAPIRDSTGEIIGVVLVFRDVTREYAVQQELHEREREMSRAQQLANLGSWRFDLTSGTVAASAQAHRIYGVDEGEITIEQAQSYALAPYREHLDAALGDLVEHGAAYDVEFEIRRASDGEIRFVHSVAEYDRCENAVVGTLHDITERKRAEQQLRIERTRFATIAELSPTGIVTVDATGVISYANPTAERVLGLHRDAITSRTYDAPEWKHTAPDGGPFPDEDQPFTIVRETLQPVYNVCHGITWPDGRHVELSINASPILDDGRRFAGMVATIEDITGRKRDEARIQALLREKETLLRESHHRITNNMNTIHGLLSLQAHSTDSPEARDVLSDASSRVQAMSRLFDRLYRNTPDGPVSIRQFLVPLVLEIVEILSPLVPVRVEASVEEVPVDARTMTMIGIVANELITNSVKHAFAGRTEGTVFLSATTRDSLITMTYRDSGPGANRADGAAAAEGGTEGFGMQLVRMMVQNLGGTMQVLPDAGFQVDLEIPVRPADTA